MKMKLVVRGLILMAYLIGVSLVTTSMSGNAVTIQITHQHAVAEHDHSDEGSHHHDHDAGSDHDVKQTSTNQASSEQLPAEHSSDVPHSHSITVSAPIFCLANFHSISFKREMNLDTETSMFAHLQPPDDRPRGSIFRPPIA